jgi:hypothetical protein
LVGVRLSISGEMSVLISFVLYSTFVGASLEELPNVCANPKAIGATERVFELLRNPEKSTDT